MFIHNDVFDEIFCESISTTNLYDKYIKWLKTPPKYTVFRINILKSFNVALLDFALNKMTKQCNVLTKPKYYFLKPDCLIVESLDIDEIEPLTDVADVIVDSECGAAVLRGSHVYAPGIMGLPSDVSLNGKVNIYADIEDKCKKGLKIKYSGEKVFVGFGKLKQTRSQLFDVEKPSGIGIEVLLSKSKLPILNEGVAPLGQLLLQNLPSIVCGWVVNPKPNETILDMCASPGNKTTHIAELSGNAAKIYALDKTELKVERIRKRCKDHGITCVESFPFDSTKCVSDNENKQKFGVMSPPFPKHCFDKVLLDGPCSALGKRPQFVNKINMKMLKSFHKLQKKLFKTAVDLVCVGGFIIYSTCTINVEENESMVVWALQQYPQMELVAAEPLLGSPGWPVNGLTEEQRLLVQRFGPENDILRPVDDIFRDTVGFFIAKFKKIC